MKQAQEVVNESIDADAAGRRSPGILT